MWTGIPGRAGSVIEGEAPRRVRPCDLRPGMRIAIYPGGRVPADGIVVESSLAVDEKAIAGYRSPRP